MKEQTKGYLIGAFGLVAGLAWNDAIKSLIESFFPFSKSGVWAKFAYAGIVTYVIVLVSLYLIKPEEKEKDCEEKNDKK